MKRFYKDASTRPVDGGWEILLDARTVRTPGRRPLAVPSAALAEAIANEWNAQGEEIAPRSMPLTGLANAAIDRVAADKEAFARSLSRYGESDLLCYRADHPAALVERQARLWDPLIAWARRRFDVDFEIVRGVMHRPQPEHTLRQLEQAVAARGPFELAGLAPLVTIAGSLVIGLALAEQAIGIDEAWTAAALDEQWQAEQWGEDSEAAAALAARRAEFEVAELFLRLL
jgi:chaperone required for assembly of F1-ATPase